MYKLSIIETSRGFRAILNHSQRPVWADCPVFDRKSRDAAEGAARKFASRVGIGISE